MSLRVCCEEKCGTELAASLPPVYLLVVIQLSWQIQQLKCRQRPLQKTAYVLTKILDGKLEFNATEVLLKASKILNTRHLSYHSVTTLIRCHRFAVTQWCSLLRVDTPEDHVAPKTKQKTLMYHGPSSLAPAVWKCEYDWSSTLVTTEFISTKRPLHFYSPQTVAVPCCFRTVSSLVWMPLLSINLLTSPRATLGTLLMRCVLALWHKKLPVKLFHTRASITPSTCVPRENRDQ